MPAIAALEPASLWSHFVALNAVPRPSKREERVIEFICEFGRQHGLEVSRDATGNVLVKKPASPGREQRAPVALQSHLDMVHQQNAGTNFDFDREGIRMVLGDDWVSAEGTTLGADNGIGVAAMMALLASKEAVHPPLEALFTVDEETGMTGAKGLQGGLMHAKVMLNLDSEDDRELTIGCAGGVDVLATGKPIYVDAPAGLEFVQLHLSGLTGGHSGMEIHLGRANANKLMNRILWHSGGRLVSLDGGGLRNAIPRESTAVLGVAPGFDRAALEATLRAEYRATDPELKLSCEKLAPQSRVLQEEYQGRLLRALYAVPSGIHRMDPGVPGLVQTSNNLARVIVREGELSVQCLTRGSVDSEKLDLACAIRCALELAGAEVKLVGEYPGWAPQPSSGIVKLMSQLHQELFGSAPHVTACHAGLECGILGRNYPDMEMVSFGPNIKGAHSPDEKVQISSVQKFWRYLNATLERL